MTPDKYVPLLKGAGLRVADLQEWTGLALRSRLRALQATRAIRADHPPTRVLIVTRHEDTDYLVEAAAAGAAGNGRSKTS